MTRPAGKSDSEGLDDDVDDPSRALSRIICPRRLHGATAYRACLIPAFAAGRDAGLERAMGAAPLEQAWETGMVELPVYHEWSFTTGEEGSFEAMARRLRARAISSAADRTIDTSVPGWGLPEKPGRRMLLSGALLPATDGDDEAADPELAVSLRDALSVGDAAPTVLRPPAYGSQQHPGPLPAHGWRAELNLDPRYRAAAGLGAWAVVLHQEELVDRAWTQLAEAHAKERTFSERAAHASMTAVEPTQTVNVVAPALVAALADSLAARHLAAVDRVSPARTRRPRLQLRTHRHLRVRADLAGSAPLFARFAPRFTEPAYTYLRAVAPEWLLAGAADLPDDTVALARSDGAFVESFLVGMNDALVRELTWRRFPVDPTATLVPAFWGAPGSVPAGTSIAAWRPDDALGSHGTTTAGEEVVLLVRGAVLRRFPGTTVVLEHAREGAGIERVLPAVAGTVDPSTTFFGFPRRVEDVRAPGPDDRWWVVLEEPQHAARFGCDDPPDSNAGSVAPGPASWQDLDWSQVTAGEPAPLHLPVKGPLVGTERPVSRQGPATETAIWGSDSAHIALATARPPFAVRIPLDLWFASATVPKPSPA